MNIYHSDTYRKDLSWLHFYDYRRVRERQQVLDEQSYITATVTYVVYPSNSWLGTPGQAWQLYSTQGNIVDL